MTLHVHHGPQLGMLADALGTLLAHPPDDPFERCVVAVPTAGVRDWLTRRLAERLGVAANITMPFPGRFLAAALGTPLDEDDPWHVDRLTWAVLDVMESGSVTVPGWSYAADGARSRRFATARKIADLFDRYAANRPQLLQQWERGAVGDGTVDADRRLVGGLDPSMRWQFELWRAVRKRIGRPSPAERLPELVEQVRAGQLEPALPASVAMFGIGALSPAQLDIVTALASVRDVHLSVITPSPVRWQRTAPAPPGRLLSRRRFDEIASGQDDGHPLVRSWGRLSIETAALLRGLGPEAIVAGCDVEREPESLLEHVQRDIRLDRSPTVYTGRREPANAGSIQVHACHGASRQLDVLRDVLGHLFTADPSLRPRDVVVVCPDVARFEPFARAVFARGSLPVPLKVTDLSLGSENPVAGALATIMSTVADRCTSVDVLAVAALEPVRRRLGITVDDLARFGAWSERLGTNWGLDSDHRSTWLDVAIDAGTWESSLQSLLLGDAMPAPAPRRAFAGIVPFDDVAGADLVSAGRLADLVARLRRVRDLSTGSGPVEHWRAVLVETLGLLCATEPADAWLMADVLRAVDGLCDQAVVGDAPVPVALDWSDVRSIVEGLVATDPGRLSLRSGRVTMTGMVPVRNVPARVVCLLGFDEVSLRPAATDGDDLLSLRPCVGERDRRREQRQLVLDALMAAEQHFVVVCDGSDITTNRRVRFAVQLAELLDVIDATMAVERPGADADSPVLVRHPRRPYDERMFGAGLPRGLDGPFSFDDTMLRAAEAGRPGRDSAYAPAPLRWSVDSPIPPVVTLEQLTDACTRPARTLLREGLDVRLPREVGPQDSNIPLSVSPLDSAAMGQRLLDRLRSANRGGGDGSDRASRQVLAEWSDAETLMAGNPPGRLIEQSLDAVSREIADMIAATESCGLDLGPGRVLSAAGEIAVDVTVRHRGRATSPRPDGAVPIGALQLRDTVPGIAGTTICRLHYRRPKARFLVRAALDLASAVSASGSVDWQALVVTRGESGSSKPRCRVVRVAGDAASAAAVIEVAAELRVAALRGAVPVFEEASCQLHKTGVLDEDLLFGNDFVGGDMADEFTRFVWGAVTMAELLELEPSVFDLAKMLWGTIDDFVTIDRASTATPTGRR